MIWRTGAKFQDLFNLRTCYSYSLTSYCMFPSFAHLKGWTGAIKMVNCFFLFVCVCVCVCKQILHNKNLEQWTIKTWDALHDFVQFAQLKKREKYQWRSVACSIVAGFLHWCFSCFKLYKRYKFMQSITRILGLIRET